MRILTTIQLLELDIPSPDLGLSALFSISLQIKYDFLL